MSGTRTIAEASRRLFGNASVTQLRSGRKLLSRKLIGPTLMSWYPPTMESYKDPYYTSAEDQRRALKLEKLRRKGKGPPPKGAGKRSKKR